MGLLPQKIGDDVLATLSLRFTLTPVNDEHDEHDEPLSPLPSLPTFLHSSKGQSLSSHSQLHSARLSLRIRMYVLFLGGSFKNIGRVTIP